MVICQVSLFFPMLYFVSNNHSFFSLYVSIFIWLNGAASYELSLIILINPQSCNRFAIVFLRDRSFVDMLVLFQSRANNSLKCTM